MQRIAQDWLVLTRTDASQRHRRRHCDGAAVRAAASASALDGLRRRSHGPAQADDGDAGRHGRAGAAAGPPHRHAVWCSCGRSMSSPSCSAAFRRSMRRRGRCSSSEMVGRRPSGQCGGPELHLVQCRPHDRPRRGGPHHRGARHRLGVHPERAFVLRRADLAALPARA